MSTASNIKFATASSQGSMLNQAIEQAVGEVTDRLDAPVDLAFAFFSAQYLSQLDDHFFKLSELLATENVLGCTAESVICQRNEIELEPAISVWAAALPDVDIATFHLKYEPHAEGGAFVGWPDQLLGDWPEGAFLLALGDPFSFPADVWLERMNDDRSGVPIVGGLASGGSQPGDCQLILGDRIFDQGCVVAYLTGPLQMQSVVSQGCRPIGEPLVITHSERNIIYELGGKPALDQLKHIYMALPTREQRLVQQGVHLGRVVNEYAESFAPGDFLIRNVIGFDEETQAIALADYVRNGQTVQFHIRDGATARVDFQQLLSARARQSGGTTMGGLSFSCNGRGSRLFETPHHDETLIQDFFGPLPLAGCFAAGEMGPIGGRNFLHGFTHSLALFQRPV